MEDNSGFTSVPAFNFRFRLPWLTVSNQIVKSLSLCYKVLFFNTVHPIDPIFCKMIKVIEQKLFNHADYLFRS